MKNNKEMLSWVAVVGLALILVLATAFLWYPPLYQKEYAPLSKQPFFEMRETSAAVSGENSYPLGRATKVSINTANLAELTVLPGVGASKAQAIIEYREENGPFAGPEDLGKVSGIGPKILEQVEDLLDYGA